MTDQTAITLFDTVDGLLAYGAAHRETRDLPVRVSGFYTGSRASRARGPARFGFLLARPEQAEDVERVDRVPADIDFGVKVSIPVMGTLGVSEPLTPPQDRSWVTMEGLLTCSETPSDTPRCRLSVTSITT